LSLLALLWTVVTECPRGQRKALKPGGKAATLQALKASLSASGLGAGDDLALGGLPSLAGLMEARSAEIGRDIGRDQPRCGALPLWLARGETGGDQPRWAEMGRDGPRPAEIS